MRRKVISMLIREGFGPMVHWAWLVILAFGVLLLSLFAWSPAGQVTHELDISGVERLFTLPIDDWEVLSREDASRAFQSLINLARLQFGLSTRGGEFERILRDDFFYYSPREPQYENVDVYREPSAEYRRDYDLDIGNSKTERYMLIRFIERDKPIFNGWYWGITEITLNRYWQEGPCCPPKTENLMFTFDYINDYATAKYIYTVENPDGTIYLQEVRAAFTYGNPDPVD